MLSINLQHFREGGFGASALFGSALACRAGDRCELIVGPARLRSEYWTDLMTSGILHLTSGFARIVSSIDRKLPYALEAQPLDEPFLARGNAYLIPNIQTRREFLSFTARDTELETDSWLDIVGLGLSRNSERLRGEISSVIWEAVWNVIDHAAAKPHPNPALVRGILSIRRYPIGSLLSTLGPTPDALSSYWRQFLAQLDGTRTREVLQIVVSDSGIGIARRHDQGWSLDPMSHAAELDAVDRAIQRGSTSKTEPNSFGTTRLAGHGLNNLSSALNALGGACTIRTGTVGCLATASSGGSFRVREEHFSNSVGTTLCVVLPIQETQMGASIIGSVETL